MRLAVLLFFLATMGAAGCSDAHGTSEPEAVELKADQDPRVVRTGGMYSAGVAVENIDPNLDRPVYLNGYLRRTAPASALDPDRPLTVRALALADAANDAAVIVTLDVAAIDEDVLVRMRGEASRATHLPPSAFFFNVTHTHTAPVARAFPLWPAHPEKDWIDSILVPRTVIAIDRAVRALAPATVSWVSGEVHADLRGRYACRNRHVGRRFYDRQIDVLDVRSEGMPLATVFVHGCHPVTLGDTTVVSADWPADARAMIEARRGGTALFVQGFGGDVDPSDLAPRGADGELARRVGRWIASDVLAALPRATELRGALTVHRAETNLPLAPPSARAPAGLHGGVTKRWESMMKELERAHRVPTHLGARGASLHLGGTNDGFRLVMSSHEVVSEYAPIVRAAFADHVAVAGYTDGVDSYLPIDAMLAERPLNNYEGFISFFYYGLPAPMATGTEAAFTSMLPSLGPRQAHNEDHVRVVRSALAEPPADDVENIDGL